MGCTPSIRVDPESLQGEPEECVEEVEREVVPYPPGRPLHPVEIAYVLYRGGEAKIGGQRLSFRDFLLLYSKRDPLAPAMFEVYLELRRRGRLPIPGPRNDTLILLKSRRNPVPTHYILVVEEGRPVKLTVLESFVEEARRRRLEPVVAIVDRYGDVTFYTTIVLHPGSAEKLAESLEATSNA